MLAIKELRSADLLAAYLRAGQEAVGKNDSELDEIAALRRLEKTITKRWRDFPGKIDEKNPVLGPWKLLAGIPDGEFAAKAKERLAHLDQAMVNPFIIADGKRD